MNSPRCRLIKKDDSNMGLVMGLMISARKTCGSTSVGACG